MRILANMLLTSNDTPGLSHLGFCHLFLDAVLLAGHRLLMAPASSPKTKFPGLAQCHKHAVSVPMGGVSFGVLPGLCAVKTAYMRSKGKVLLF